MHLQPRYQNCARISAPYVEVADKEAQHALLFHLNYCLHMSFYFAREKNLVHMYWEC